MTPSQFNSPYVQDLAWLVEGHYIVQDFDLSLYWCLDLNEKLAQLDARPEVLNQAVLSCKSHFLGSYFESLFSFAITHLSTLTPVLEHEQIVSDKRTIGEIDMIVEEPNGQLHQFEVAIKFYLQRMDLIPHHWIGPNKNDSLLKKETKARNHQLAILNTEIGREFVYPVTQGREISTHLLIFGRLYHPLTTQKNIRELPVGNEIGYWVRVSDFLLIASRFSHMKVMEKPHWMVFENNTDGIVYISLHKVYSFAGSINADNRPRHIALWREKEEMSHSVFVVPDAW
ncbi:DUF1853 family protein [Marinomonas sp.]|nr:DUF1853 family protein [Marinomonas sp.]MDB4837376.1 DUF1853 family protein [Marinomonas sp.]